MANRQRDARGRFVSNGAATNSEALAVERLNFARRGGIQYGGERDVYKVAGYKREPTFEDYMAYYERHPIAARIIDMPAQTTWRHAPEVVQPDEGEDGSEFSKAFNALADRLQLWSRFERVDRTARIGEYAVLLIGATDARRPEQLERPLSKLGPEGLAYISHYSQKYAQIDTWVTDPSNERFGLPETYRIDLSRNNSRFRAGSVIVHASRVIHVAEDVLEDDVFGRPALKRVLNTVFNDEKVDAASAEAFWQLADKILQLNIDPDVVGADIDLADIDEKIQAIYHDLRKHFYMQGGELSWLGGDAPDPSAISEVLATKMAAGGNIPKRILFGAERGELASQQDERTWHGNITERQVHHGEPVILRPFTDRMIEYGVLPRPSADGYECQWPNLYSPSEEEIATRNKTVAETAAALTPIGGDPSDMVELDSERNLWLRPMDEVRREREARERNMGPADDLGDEPPVAEPEQGVDAA